MRPVIAALFLFFMPAFPPNEAHALESGNLYLSKSLPHYANDMEFYYINPRPEIAPGLIDSLDRLGLLEHGEKCLMLAAFLAELAKKGDIDLAELAASGKRRTRAAKRVLAWSAHLARDKNEHELLKDLLGTDSQILQKQIKESPAPLSAWNIMKEKSVLQMFWAAFMASGNTAWLDAVISAALEYGSASAAGRRNDPAFAVCATAAASLYELAPRHLAVVERLKTRLSKCSGPEREVLSTILAHCANKGGDGNPVPKN